MPKVLIAPELSPRLGECSIDSQRLAEAMVGTGIPEQTVDSLEVVLSADYFIPRYAPDDQALTCNSGILASYTPDRHRLTLMPRNIRRRTPEQFARDMGVSETDVSLSSRCNIVLAHQNSHLRDEIHLTPDTVFQRSLLKHMEFVGHTHGVIKLAGAMLGLSVGALVGDQFSTSLAGTFFGSTVGGLNASILAGEIGRRWTYNSPLNIECKEKLKELEQIHEERAGRFVSNPIVRDLFDGIINIELKKPVLI